MSDQPKPRKQDAAMPTTERYGPFPKGDYLRQPKPRKQDAAMPTTGGEWTVDGDFINLGNGSLGTSLRAIANAHNAALAAAYDTGYSLGVTHGKAFVTPGQKELAAEREKVDQWRWKAERNERYGREQLAAEREALRWEKQEHAKAWEKMQPLVDALTQIRESDCMNAPSGAWAIQTIDAALAKVKEGK